MDNNRILYPETLMMSLCVAVKMQMVGAFCIIGLTAERDNPISPNDNRISKNKIKTQPVKMHILRRTATLLSEVISKTYISQ